MGGRDRSEVGEVLGADDTVGMSAQTGQPQRVSPASEDQMITETRNQQYLFIMITTVIKFYINPYDFYFFEISLFRRSL